jgi:Aerobic-type carbon monoxide dehydrogenase, large subunit CoxL/CutL homologs
VTHTASGRKLSYGALAIAASSEAPPKDVPLKDPKDFVYIGQPLKRLDTPDKVNGKAVYGIDAILPDMKFATVAACPVFGGKVGKVDDSAAKKIPGVRKIVVLDDMVAVIGDHMWAAKKGLDALKIDWDEGPNARSVRKTSGSTCARPAKRTARSPNRSATSPRDSRRAKSSRRHTSCRSSRTRRWSR